MGHRLDDEPPGAALPAGLAAEVGEKRGEASDAVCLSSIGGRVARRGQAQRRAVLSKLLRTLVEFLAPLGGSWFVHRWVVGAQHAVPAPVRLLRIQRARHAVPLHGLRLRPLRSAHVAGAKKDGVEKEAGLTRSWTGLERSYRCAALDSRSFSTTLPAWLCNLFGEGSNSLR